MGRCSPPPRKLLLISLLAVLSLPFAFAQMAQGQSAQSQPNASSHVQPISVPHLYWHFLIHQSVLDAAAAQLTAQGKNGNILRNDLQTKLGFSDADYAPIRTASQRLASELQPIDTQMKTLANSSGNASQAQALIAQREAFVATEIYNLSLELSPQNKTALESFMANFFAPKQLTVAPPAAQTAGQAVAK